MSVLSSSGAYRLTNRRLPPRSMCKVVTRLKAQSLPTRSQNYEG